MSGNSGGLKKNHLPNFQQFWEWNQILKWYFRRRVFFFCSFVLNSCFFFRKLFIYSTCYLRNPCPFFFPKQFGASSSFPLFERVTGRTPPLWCIGKGQRYFERKDNSWTWHKGYHLQKSHRVFCSGHQITPFGGVKQGKLYGNFEEFPL